MPASSYSLTNVEHVLAVVDALGDAVEEDVRGVVGLGGVGAGGLAELLLVGRGELGDGRARPGCRGR